MVVATPRIVIVSPTAVHKSMMRLDRLYGAQTHHLSLLMDGVETWTLDDVITDDAGNPAGVTDERGAAKDKVAALESFQQLLNSQVFYDVFRAQVRSAQATSVDSDLYEVLHMLKTTRFELVVRHLNQIVSDITTSFPEHFLRKLSISGKEGNIAAHVLLERITVLARASAIQVIFSGESAASVDQTIRMLKLDVEHE